MRDLVRCAVAFARGRGLSETERGVFLVWVGIILTNPVAAALCGSGREYDTALDFISGFLALRRLQEMVLMEALVRALLSEAFLNDPLSLEALVQMFLEL